MRFVMMKASKILVHQKNLAEMNMVRFKPLMVKCRPPLNQLLNHSFQTCHKSNFVNDGFSRAYHDKDESTRTCYQKNGQNGDSHKETSDSSYKVEYGSVEECLKSDDGDGVTVDH